MSQHHPPLSPGAEKKKIHRRKALQLSAGSLLTLGLWPGCLSSPDRHSGSFRFLVVNDTHYMSPECGTWLDGVVQQMRSHPEVEFCLLAGDLTEHGKAGDLAAVRDIFNQLGIPTYVQIGNHDYLTQTDRTAYEDLFPGRLNYSFRHRGWQFIGLDTSDGLLYQDTTIQPPTFGWLKDELPRLDPQRPTVLFTHFPLGAEVRYRPKNADDLLEHFLPINLQAAFSGHFHGYTAHTFQNASLTTNRCCALKRDNHDNTKEKGYFLCTASQGTISRSFIQIVPPSV